MVSLLFRCSFRRIFINILQAVFFNSLEEEVQMFPSCLFACLLLFCLGFFQHSSQICYLSPKDLNTLSSTFLIVYLKYSEFHFNSPTGFLAISHCITFLVTALEMVIYFLKFYSLLRVNIVPPHIKCRNLWPYSIWTTFESFL